MQTVLRNFEKRHWLQDALFSLPSAIIYTYHILKSPYKQIEKAFEVKIRTA